MLQIVRFGLDQVPAYATFASAGARRENMRNMGRLHRYRAEVIGAVEAWLLEDDAA
jgi:hypothetical protein